jgi:hypothetical protein
MRWIAAIVAVPLVAVALFVVRDRSARRGFRVAGRGVNRATDMSFRGPAAWRVRLTQGVYRFGTDAKHLAGRLRVD